MRVSTGEQDLDLQRTGLQRAGFERVYDDVCSFRATDPPGLSTTMEIARAGDALVVWKLAHIGRSLPRVVGLMKELQQRGVGLQFLTRDRDTTTTTGRLVFGIVATLVEFERDLIHEQRWQGLQRPAPVERPAAGHAGQPMNYLPSAQQSKMLRRRSDDLAIRVPERQPGT